MKQQIRTRADRDEVRRICREAHSAGVCNANDTLPDALDLIDALTDDHAAAIEAMKSEIETSHDRERNLLAEVDRLTQNVHISAQTMLTDAQKDLIGYREAQDVGIVVTRICSAWNDTLAENQRLREALRPFADMWSPRYESKINNRCKAAHDALEDK